MLARNEIQRSIASMTLRLQQDIAHRKGLYDNYGLAEREFQAQCDFSGTVGTVPAQAPIAIPFSLIYPSNPGMVRDSGLGRPHARLSFELIQGPDGLIPYAYVQSWLQDPDYNYVGAVVLVGVHYPGLALGVPPSTASFKGILHAAFQGWATPNENSTDPTNATPAIDPFSYGGGSNP
jgi:hypothetical protein